MEKYVRMEEVIDQTFVALLILTKTGQTEEQTNESYEKIQFEI